MATTYKRSHRVDIDERTINAANYYIYTGGATLRSTGKEFGVAESTIHQNLTIRLKKLNMELYLQVQKKIEYNKSVRHIRGGIATKIKWERIRSGNLSCCDCECNCHNEK